MNEVIRTLIRWDKFSKTETTFYAEIEEGENTQNYSYTVIFENGYVATWEYRRWFGERIKLSFFRV